MRIAILCKGLGHKECIGFIAELSKQLNYKIDVYRNNEYFEYVGYFQKIYNYNTYYFEDLKKNKSKYDYFIKTTSRDKIPEVDNLINVISILHIGGNSEYRGISKKLITLSPYVYIKKGYINKYIFPFYNGINCFNNKKIINKTITWIGRLLDSQIDKDFISFIEKLNKINYRINFVIGTAGKHKRGEKIRKKNFRNCFFYTDDKSNGTFSLINILKKTDFVLSRKLKFQPLKHRGVHYKTKNRFSGALTLALSHNVPLIYEKELSNDYNIQNCGLEFNKDYCDILNKLKFLKQNTYIDYINNIKNIRNNIINENKKKFFDLLN